MTTNQQTPEADVLYLAGLMKPCPEDTVDDYHSKSNCSVSNDADEVPKYPALREKCPSGHIVTTCECTLKFIKTEPYPHCPTCATCQGRGWLPVSLERAADVMRRNEHFQKWLAQEYASPTEIHGVAEAVIYILCDPADVVAAAAKMEREGKRFGELYQVNRVLSILHVEHEQAQWMRDGALLAICKRLGWECRWVNDEWQGWGWMVSSEWADTLTDAAYKAMGGEE